MATTTGTVYGDWIYDTTNMHWRPCLSVDILDETPTTIVLQVIGKIETADYYVSTGNEESKTLQGTLRYKVNNEETWHTYGTVDIPYDSNIGTRNFISIDISFPKIIQQAKTVKIQLDINGIKSGDFYWDDVFNTPERSIAIFTTSIDPLSYVITYNANGGIGEMAPSSTFSSINLRWNSFTRTGYNFIGWNTKADGTGIGYNDGATYLGESVTLYAQWKEISWIDSITYQKEEDGVSQQIKFFIGTTFDRVYDTVARGFSLQDLAIALKRFFKKQAFMIYAGNKPADYSKVMEWYAISGDTSDLEIDPALVVIDSDV